jgi:hypothetical protein
MNDPTGESPLLRVREWVQQHTALTIAIMAAVMLLGFVLSQPIIMALGSMGLWFALYPGLAGSPRRKPSQHNQASLAKSAPPSAFAKSDPAKPLHSYGKQIQHVLQMQQQIETAARRIRDPHLRQVGERITDSLPGLVDNIYQLARLAEQGWGTATSINSQETATAQLRRLDAQIDHAVSLFDLLLYQTLAAAGDGGAQDQQVPRDTYEAWPENLKREAEWLRAAAKGSSQLLT